MPIGTVSMAAGAAMLVLGQIIVRRKIHVLDVASNKSGKERKHLVKQYRNELSANSVSLFSGIENVVHIEHFVEVEDGDGNNNHRNGTSTEMGKADIGVLDGFRV